MADHQEEAWPWQDNLDAEQGLAVAQKTIEAVQEDINRATALHKLFTTAAYDKEIMAAFDQTYEAHGVNLVLDALQNSLVIILARVFEEDRENSASIRSMLTLMRSRKAKKALLANWSWC